MLFLLLIGRGVEWLPGGPKPQGSSGEPRPEPAAAAAAAERREPPPRAPEPVTAEPPHVEATPVEPARDAERVPSEQAPAAPRTIDDDRFGSWSELVRGLLDQGRLDAARASLQRLAAEPLAPAQQAELDGLSARLAAATAAFAREIQELVQRGHVLRAHLAVARADERGGALGVPFAEVDGPLPQPAPLPRNRRVRLSWQDGEQVGTVAQSRSDQVTVRLATALGQSYPTVPVVACEPVDATAAEAVEMAWAAVHAGEPALARLWLLRARTAGDGARDDRDERLRKLVRLLGEGG